MQLPDTLKEAIEKEASRHSLNALSAAYESLSRRYRSIVEPSSHNLTDADRLGYIISRMPATYAAAYTVLQRLQQHIPSFSPQFICDIGSGPSTALWACSELFDKIERFHAFEMDTGFIHIAKKLTQATSIQEKTTWHEGLVESLESLPSSDLTILCYSLSEIPANCQEKLLSKLWQSTTTLVIIEPGTPLCYQRGMLLRDHLLRQNAPLIAPCPHIRPCPMQKEDWCHFYARIERTSLHRKIKGGALGYEDEKFFYLIFSKVMPPSSHAARLIRFPIIHKGHTQLTLCTENEGIITKTVTKKDKETYKKAKKLDWGDVI